jgi:hypothetical protein
MTGSAKTELPLERTLGSAWGQVAGEGTTPRATKKTEWSAAALGYVFLRPGKIVAARTNPGHSSANGRVCSRGENYGSRVTVERCTYTAERFPFDAEIRSAPDGPESKDTLLATQFHLVLSPPASNSLSALTLAPNQRLISVVGAATLLCSGVLRFCGFQGRFFLRTKTQVKLGTLLIYPE